MEKEANGVKSLGGDTVTRCSKVTVTKLHDTHEEKATKCGCLSFWPTLTAC